VENRLEQTPVPPEAPRGPAPEEPVRPATDEEVEAAVEAFFRRYRRALERLGKC